MPDINRHVRTQHGLITLDQAKSAGLTPRQVQRRVKSGLWVRERPRLYRLESHPPTWHSRTLAAVLATDGVASHRSASALWRLGVHDAPPPEVTVPPGRSVRHHGMTIHQTRQWALLRSTTIDNIRCAGIERTIIDCAAVCDADTLERLAEAALRMGLTTWDRLWRCLEQHSAQARNGCGPLRALLVARATKPTVTLSDFSLGMKQLLVADGLPEPVVEFQIVDGDGSHVLQADLAWPPLWKIVECDGLEHHFGRADMERDHRKRAKVMSLGWSIQPVTYSMCRDEPDELLRLVRAFLLH